MTKLITIILMVATFSVATINQINVNAKNTSSQSNPSSSKANFSSSSDLSKASSSSSSESSTSDLTKTKTKAKLKLDATHPKFLDKANPEVTKLMQDAILKTLKKWKGELPTDNTFTITSWAKLKSDTADQSIQHKKKKPTTPNSWVIYMWSQTPNLNWSKDKVPTDEDRESGDPRIIRTEFNVLLKQNNKGEFKATLERDQELTKESAESIEDAQDTKIHQDLFQLNKTDNIFTALEEVIGDEDNSSNSSSSSSSNISSSVSTTSYSINSSSHNSYSSKSIGNSTSSTLSQNVNSNSSSSTQNSTSQVVSSVNNSSKPASSTITSFLDKLFNFGSVQASAGEYDYSWPWKKGETWTVTQGWHECESYTPETVKVSGCALDFAPTNGASNIVLAPKTATIQRACKDNYHASVKFDNMSILHLETATMTSSNDVTINKNQMIGNLYLSPVDSRCGRSTGPHLHIKFAASPIIVDGSSLTHNSGYGYGTLVTSNQSTPPFNPYNGMIRSSGNSNFVFDVANNDPTIRHLLSYGETMVV